MNQRAYLKNLQIKISVCILGMSLLFLCFLASFATSVPDNYPEIARVEKLLFDKSSPEINISDRLTRIEKSLFNKSYLSEDLQKRSDRIKFYVIGNSLDEEENPKNVTESDNKQDVLQNTDEEGYENIQTEEIDKSQFIDLLIKKINLERGFKGLLTVKPDTISTIVAEEHSNELIKRGYLSYFDTKHQGPDERYSLAGGTGVVSEIVNGFQEDKQIKLSELLAKQLIQAINLNADDSNILYSSYVTEIGCGISLSKDKKSFVSALEFITKGGDFEPLKPVLNFGEKLTIKGKVLPPYKFKAISIAYFDKPSLDDSEITEQEPNFDDDQIIPYFPPQDYIAFADLAKTNIGKVLKGLGVIAALGGAPFTGGATAVLAPPLISSIQNGPPKEVPLKGGIKSNSDGEIFGELELNYQGKSGIYFISVLAELPGVNASIVISRRTVRVKSPLQPALSKK